MPATSKRNVTGKGFEKGNKADEGSEDNSQIQLV